MLRSAKKLHNLIFLSFAIFSLSTISGNALAIPYQLSGTATSFDGTSITESVTGTLNIGDTPVLAYEIEEPTVLYSITYSLDYTFMIGSDIFTGAGTMRLLVHGAGLFDASFGGLNRSVTDGTDTYMWDATEGTFYYDDGTAYPDLSTDPLAYTVLPDRIEFIGSSLRSDTTVYLFYSTLVAEQISSVPEPGSIVLMLIGLAGIRFLGKRMQIKNSTETF